MENEISLFELQVDDASSSFLSETSRWAKFLAIIGFIGMGLMVAGGLCLVIFSSSMGVTGSQSVIQFALLLGFALVYFFPCLYLFRFAGRMQQALRINDQTSLTNAFSNLKSCFKFMGILTLIILVIYGLIFLFAIVGTISRY